MDQRKFVFFSAITGNILEYYDFTVYVIFTNIIAQTFFPAASEYAQVLMSLSVFASGFITRPIGGIFFGYIGDRYGRRIALICSMVGMTIPTFAMGLIPNYSEIGIYAPIFLVIFRLMQGLCISGEGAGAAIFVLEHQNSVGPGFITGLVHGSNIVGSLIAGFIGIAISKFFPGVEYAWRFAFILGGFMGIIGFYLRLRVSETPIFMELSEKRGTFKMPFFHVIRHAFPSIVLTFCVAAVTSSIVYMVKTYVLVLYSNIMHYEESEALWYLSYANIVMMITMPLSGMLVDRIGKVTVMRGAVISVIIFAIPVLVFMSSVETYKQLISLTILAVMAGAMSGSAYLFVISLFKPEERFTGVAFSYNLGIAIFGGPSAIISRWLIESTHILYSPAFYIMTTSVFFLFIMFLMRRLIRTIA